MNSDEILVFFLIFILLFAMLQYNILGFKDMLCGIFKDNETIRRILGCGGGVIVPKDDEDDGGGGDGGGGDGGGGDGKTTTVGGQSSDRALSSDGKTVITSGAPSGKIATVFTGGPPYESYSKAASAPILQYINSRPSSTIKGSYSPTIKGVSIGFYTDVIRDSGWYKFQMLAMYEGCTFDESKAFIAPMQTLYAACDGKGNCYSPAYPSGTRPLTKRELLNIVYGNSTRKGACPNGWSAGLSASSIPPEYAWACMVYWSMMDNKEARAMFNAASDDSYVVPMQRLNEPYFKTLISVIAPIDLVNNYIIGPCSSSSLQQVLVYYRVLYCGGANERAAPPDSACKPYTSWQLGTTVKVYTMSVPTPGTDEALNQYLSVKYGGVDIIEVNGRVYSLVSLQSFGLKDKFYMSPVDVAINAGISFITAGALILVYRFVKVRRR